jgi:hypothetical protein
MKIKKFSLGIVCIILFYNIPQKFYGQNLESNQEYYKLFDSIIGVGNNGIYNGIEYEKNFISSEQSHEFYLNSNFLIGNIVYNNQPYYNISLKYDTYNEDIVVKLPSYNSYYVIKLLQQQVHSFTINNVNFVRLQSNINTFSKVNVNGFYEIIYNGPKLKIYKKHKKTLKKKLNESYAYNVFKEKYAYIYFYNNEYYEIKSKGDFLKVFPSFKKTINTFYNSNTKLKKDNYDNFLFKISELLNSKLST